MNNPSGITVALQLRSALIRAIQPLNALVPMVVTEFGIVMPVREEQLKNASLPMVTRVSGRATLSSEI